MRLRVARVPALMVTAALTVIGAATGDWLVAVSGAGPFCLLAASMIRERPRGPR